MSGAPVEIAAQVVRWQAEHGRNQLPWQNTRDAYRVWLSEIMLQQTQVVTVIPYYQRFLARFPTLADLAAAQQDEVLALWSGLGYYSRARNLHRAARIVAAEHGGVFPRHREQVAALPGIGPSTAAAICAFAFGQRHAILDGNVKRVLCRFFGIDGYPGDRPVEARLWQIADALAPASGIEAYTQAQMDLGATVCSRSKPQCRLCPLQQGCVARIEGRAASLPTPKPKKANPERETVMLLVRQHDRLLLQKRPPTGIWAGLWSLPEIDSTLQAEAWCQTALGCRGDIEPPLAPFRHAFTHFRLHITPLPVWVAPVLQAQQPGLQWLTLTQALQAGIPAPVRRILLGLR